MATVNGADFNTQCYRHGVLIGNWNEDQYGCDLLNTGAQIDPMYDTHVRSVQRSSFTNVGHSLVHADLFHSKSRLRKSSEVEKHMLFEHKGVDSNVLQHETTYSTTYVPPTSSSLDKTATATTTFSSTQKPLNKTIYKQSDWSDQKIDCGRTRSYRTTTSDAYHYGNSSLAVPVSHQMHARKSLMERGFDGSFRQLRLRKS